MKIFGLIQARMDSTRLPNKVMMKIAGHPILEHIRKRLEKVTLLEGIILATTSSPSNDPIVQWAKDKEILFYRHPEENDICGRLYEAFNLTNADYFLKINADCPLVDPSILMIAIDMLLKNSQCDYISNKLVPSYAMGYTFEIVSRKAINYCFENLKDKNDRELVLMWIKDHPQIFKVLGFKDKDNFSEFNLCVDTEEDFLEVSKIFETLYGNNPFFGYNEVKEYIIKREK